jgi:hypothetical protein
VDSQAKLNTQAQYISHLETTNAESNRAAIRVANEQGYKRAQGEMMVKAKTLESEL